MKRKFAVLLVFMLLNCLKQAKSDVSDDECKITIEPIPAVDKREIESNNALPTPEPPKAVLPGHARQDQKSLLIIFDATGSMGTNLAQVKASAREIVQSLATHAENPIHNYVLSVFRDPPTDPVVEPIIDTKISSNLISGIDAITVSGGNGDCPEYAMTGIKMALEHALPNSLAYVFTDTGAEDHILYDQVVKMAQEKQVKVSFLLTGVCGGKNTIKYEVYEKLARLTDGQVFDMARESVKDVLNLITKSLDPKFESLKSLDFSSAGTSNTGISVDKSFKELSVTVAGQNAKLTIKDNNDVQVVASSTFSADNIKIMTFPVHSASLNIEASSSSAYSVRIGGKSDLKIEFGFSTALTARRSDTAQQPFDGLPNIISVYVSDPSLVKCMSKVTLIAADEKNPFTALVIPLRKIVEKQFSTKLFSIPDKTFKIQVTGYDSSGTLIERLISTGLVGAKPAPPTLNITANNLIINQNSQLYMNCLVHSFAPVKVTWMFNSEIVRQNTTEQSASFVMSIDKFESKFAGKYSCIAENEHGKVSKEIEITIRVAPIVEVVPKTIEVAKGEIATLECRTKNADLSHDIIWFDEFGFPIRSNESTYSFKAGLSHHNKPITCFIKDNVFDVASSSLVTVVFAPEFTYKFNGSLINRFITKGSEMKIKCEVRANPDATVKWFYTDNDKDLSTFKLIEDKDTSLVRPQMKRSLQGMYKCIVENTVGFAVKFFDVKLDPKGPPIIKTKPKVVVKEDQAAELECSCSNCTPVMHATWRRTIGKKQKDVKGFKHYVDEDKDMFVTKLVILKAQKNDIGSYICEIVNKNKTSRMNVYLNVEKKHVKPKNMIIRLMHGKKLYKTIDDVVVIDKLVNFYIDCLSDAFPPPKVTWFKNGKQIGSNELQLPKSDIINHAGKYEVVVENVVGKISHSFEVKMRLGPSTRQTKIQTREIDEEQSLTLHCEIVGSPEPDITWTQNGVDLSLSADHSLSRQNKVLRFRGNEKLSGNYTCTGVNELGKEQITFEVFVNSPPKIYGEQNQLETIKMHTESPLELNCEATGYPKPEVNWYKSNKVIQTGSFFKILSLKGSDAGNYYCKAKNHHGEASKRFDVNVVEAPYFIVDLENLTLSAGEIRKVECIAFGTPDPKIYWEHDGALIWEGEELEIKDFSAGTYTCVAENSEGRIKNPFELEILKKKLVILPGYDESNKTLFVKAGDIVKLLCPFENYESISWINNGIDSLKEESNELEIVKADESSQGIYECTASTDDESRKFTYTIEIFAKPKIADKNGIPKDFSFERTSVQARETALELKCENSGNPKPTVQWERHGKVIGTDETFVIEKIQPTDMGEYECVAENSQGTARKVFDVEVTTPPFIEDGQKQVFKQGYSDEDLLLKCAIDGHPKPTFYWFRNDNIINTWGSATLILNEFSARHIGEYTCIAKNKYGEASIVFTTTVVNRLKIISATFDEVINRKMFTCVVDTELRPVISIRGSKGKLALFDTASKELPINRTIYFDHNGFETRFTEPKTLLNSGHEHFSAVSRISETSFKIALNTKSLRRPETFKCVTEGEDMNNEKEFVSAQNVGFVDGEGSRQHISATLNQNLTLFCKIKAYDKNNVWWYMDRKEIKPDSTEFKHQDTRLFIESLQPGYENAFSCTARDRTGKKFYRNFEIRYEWSDWSEWGDCSRTCGTGYRTQTRTCIGSEKCIGRDRRYQYCTLKSC